ncbi:hypothetical protein Asi03nite_38980 [Actinoplanes siamensis]|uniref:Uncharacterized protein n=1 Tax=Actinoplanes siamensis TaxID=1223317 RepID=A0A919N8Q2_9ACTN|nr:hypothetical protein Asi03nite_38980 [Actinoplanes siamensis]
MTAQPEPYEDDEPPSYVVVSPRMSADGRPGEVLWYDTGSGPGREVWVPDAEPQES